MKKILIVVTLCMLSVAIYAQEDVIKFLGIPVDGAKTDMIQKLKSKGFTSSLVDKDMLVGKFNGADVNIHIVTNGDMVYRIAIFDANSTNEIDIKIRFNMLCSQFQNNKKYLSASSSDNSLSEDENILYGLLIKKKRYQASYYQLPEAMDTLAIQNAILSKYTKDEVSNATEESKKEIIATALSTILEKISKKSVWFMINEDRGKYYISMFYDNEYNKANGEDL